jgi:hypothetical protein
MLSSKDDLKKFSSHFGNTNYTCLLTFTIAPNFEKDSPILAKKFKNFGKKYVIYLSV